MPSARQSSQTSSGERRTKRGKDAGRPNSSAIWPTEDAAPRSVRRRQIAVLALCGAIGASSLAGCETTQEQAAAQRAESERILEARAKRQAQKKKQGHSQQNQGGHHQQNQQKGQG